MDFIIDFYKSLDALNLIIFWGIIIVIVLLLIFSMILINKNKKLKTIIEQRNKEEDSLLLAKDKREEKKQKVENEVDIDLPIINKQVDAPKIEQPQEQEITNKPIETEKKFIAEEHVIEYNKELFSLPNIKKTSEYQEENASDKNEPNQALKEKTGPYQRNILREMSLSQTSPIGINYQPPREKSREIPKNTASTIISKPAEENQNIQTIMNKEQEKNVEEEINKKVKEELETITNTNANPRKTEITPASSKSKYEEINRQQEPLNCAKTHYNNRISREGENELLEKKQEIAKEKTIKNYNEKYLEEVSRKLEEAEIPDEIERTDYELEQEKNAIISYKELMEKKDSIQTVDEEEAIISIEELMQRNNEKKKEQEEKAKLYKLNDAEENENFIKELKQFRNDL